jgi:hypothetical protein
MPLGELVFAAALATFGVVSLWVRIALPARRARARMAFWREAAAEAGVTDLGSLGDGVLSGSADPFRLRFTEYVEGESRGTRLQIWSKRLAPGLRLGPEPPGSFLGRRDRKEIEVGDDAFDRETSVQGSPALALALLDGDMRRCVRALVRGRLDVRGHRPLWASGQLDEGVLWIDVPERAQVAPRPAFSRSDENPEPAGLYYLDGEHKLPQVLRAAFELGARLSRPEDLAARLAERLATESEARVRLNLLLTLLREFPEHPAARQAAVAARDDPDARVRLRAGIALGAEGRDVLLGIAGGEGAEDDTSARAVAALGNSLTSPQVRDFLKNALRTQREATAHRCLRILGQMGGPEAIHALTQVLSVESGPRRPSALAIEAAAALADTGDAVVEPALLEALRSPSTLVGIAAARALGRVGTAAAVIPLREVEAREGSLRSAARQAVAEIQARLGGAAPGQLSLAEGESGRLSLAEGEYGQLSLADDSTSLRVLRSTRSGPSNRS